MRIICILLLLSINSLHAQVQDTILNLPSGQIILNLSVTETKEVEQDLLVANLNYQNTMQNPADLQNKINQIVKQAIDIVKKDSNIKVRTQSYQVYETRDHVTKERLWQGSQTISLKSKKSESILEAVRQLQELGLKVLQLNYVLDPNSYAEVKDQLMETALKNLVAKANRVAQTLGKSTAELKDINIDSSTNTHNHYAQPVILRSGGSEAYSSPVAEAGDEVVTLIISARALIKP